MGFRSTWLRIAALVASTFVVESADLRAAHAAPTDETDASAAGPRDVTYPYAQRQYMTSRHGPGALAHVTPGVARGERVPVVVYLHGMNKEGRVHPRLDGAADDLRPVVDRLVRSGKVAPFVLAAPTHVRFARHAKVMFPDFDVDGFVAATQLALGDRVELDRDHVIVVGHSGGGCNVHGGLVSAALRGHVAAAVAVDTCLEPEHEDALVEVAKVTDLRVFWQRGWRRPFDTFAPRCTREGTCQVEELSEAELEHGNPHARALPVALARVLPELLAPAEPEPLHPGTPVAALDLPRDLASRHP